MTLRVQLVTLALQDGRYRQVALALETAKACTQVDDIPIMLLAFSQLRPLYPDFDDETIPEIAGKLFHTYGRRLFNQDREVGFSSSFLNMPVPDSIIQ